MKNCILYKEIESESQMICSEILDHFFDTEQLELKRNLFEKPVTNESDIATVCVLRFSSEHLFHYKEQ